MDEINKAIKYYLDQRNQILKKVNNSNNLTADNIIESGKELSILEYKLTALEVAKENH